MRTVILVSSLHAFSLKAALQLNTWDSLIEKNTPTPKAVIYPLSRCPRSSILRSMAAVPLALSLAKFHPVSQSSAHTSPQRSATLSAQVLPERQSEHLEVPKSATFPHIPGA